MASEAEIKECFMVFDTESQGTLTLAETQHAVRALGLNPPETGLGDIISEKISGARAVPYDKFKEIYEAAKAIGSSTDGLKESFELFQKGASDISGAELKTILCGMGERMHEKDGDELLQRGALALDSKITCDSFMKMTTEKLT